MSQDLQKLLQAKKAAGRQNEIVLDPNQLDVQQSTQEAPKKQTKQPVESSNQWEEHTEGTAYQITGKKIKSNKETEQEKKQAPKGSLENTWGEVEAPAMKEEVKNPLEKPKKSGGSILAAASGQRGPGSQAQAQKVLAKAYFPGLGEEAPPQAEEEEQPAETGPKFTPWGDDKSPEDDGRPKFMNKKGVTAKPSEPIVRGPAEPTPAPKKEEEFSASPMKFTNKKGVPTKDVPMVRAQPEPEAPPKPSPKKEEDEWSQVPVKFTNTKSGGTNLKPIERNLQEEKLLSVQAELEAKQAEEKRLYEERKMKRDAKDLREKEGGAGEKPVRRVESEKVEKTDKPPKFENSEKANKPVKATSEKSEKPVKVPVKEAPPKEEEPKKEALPHGPKEIHAVAHMVGWDD
jgi:hypothetical protein